MKQEDRTQASRKDPSKEKRTLKAEKIPQRKRDRSTLDEYCALMNTAHGIVFAKAFLLVSLQCARQCRVLCRRIFLGDAQNHSSIFERVARA